MGRRGDGVLRLDRMFGKDGRCVYFVIPKFCHEEGVEDGCCFWGLEIDGLGYDTRLDGVDEMCKLYRLLGNPHLRFPVRD